MDFIHGETLERKIVRSLIGGNDTIEKCNDALRVVAAGLASFHQIQEFQNPLVRNPKSNLTLVESFKKATRQSPVFDNASSKSTVNYEGIFENLPELFWKRHEKRLILTDFSPKNILVGTGGEIYFIDISYGVGHPLLNISSFVTGLTRILVRMILPGARIRVYQEFFIKQYFKHGFQYLIEDLPFFRMWSLLFNSSEHLTNRTLFRPYLLRFYRNELNRIVTDS